MSNSAGSGKLALLVGGGPAPGINGVISAVTIEAIEQGIEVIGFRDGFKWLVTMNSGQTFSWPYTSNLPRKPANWPTQGIRESK